MGECGYVNESFLAWESSHGLDEDDAVEVRVDAYSTSGGFREAAESLAKDKASDWEYPDSLELFIRKESTRELRYIELTRESYPEYVDQDAYDADEHLVVFAMTSLARAALAHRPRGWDWKDQRWRRNNPESAAAQDTERAQARFERLDGRFPWPVGHAPKTWADVVWPEWLPQELIVEATWQKHGRTHPSEYENTFASNNAQPRLGEVVTLHALCSRDFVTGKYIGSFNGMGYVVRDDGQWTRGGVLHGDAETQQATIARLKAGWLRDDLSRELDRALKSADVDAMSAALACLRPSTPVSAEASNGP